MGYYEEELMRQAKASLARLEAQPRVNCPVVGLDRVRVYGSYEGGQNCSSIGPWHLVADPESVKPLAPKASTTDPESVNAKLLKPKGK